MANLNPTKAAVRRTLTVAGAPSAGTDANMMWVVVCTSATSWHGFTITAATLAAMEAAAP